ncbi:ammonium transporter [Oceanicola granulosus HTCC2516]|uniref:Ammonium transporter n=1 Tax=Oceanicola granulosus (strain ATCC BAA-861 / DSM 15982 / KCTC 12143 / HTCC2516) TaxID=314256 RepID=Q2CAF8_OCEGH|nr:ammonium transporter [Oceanicola granulosus]EAR49676.1 ammonium transporter [Oceanicola granulosus HTCC2516]
MTFMKTWLAAFFIALIAMTAAPEAAWAQDDTVAVETAEDPAGDVATIAETETEAAPVAEMTPPNEEIGYILTTFMFLVTGILVMWMAAGFTMLEAGLVRQKNTTMQLMKNISLFSIAAIMYYVVGYNLMYPGDGWVMSGYVGAFGVSVLEAVGLMDGDVAVETDLTYASVGSDFFFQLMFCATTASIVSGALAERIKLWPFLIFVVVLTGFIYPIQASWKWGGGFLAPGVDGVTDFLDFAGSTVVHSTGGWAALAGALILGPRLGKYRDGRVNPMPGANLPLATLGTFILWMGWFGFNGGSQLYMDTAGNVADISRIMANTNTAAAGGAIAALILTQMLYKKSDLTMVLNGALAGLVSITAEPLTPSLGAATLIGAVGGVIVVFAVPFLDKLKIDDVVGAIPVHLFAGIWGTLAVVLTNPDATLGKQLYSIVVVGVFVFVVSAVVWLILRAVMGIRVSEEDEINGLDTAELGMEAYPEFAKG